MILDQKCIQVWLLSNGVDYSLICRKPTKLLKELHYLGLKRVEIVENEKRTLGPQPSMERKQSYRAAQMQI